MTKFNTVHDISNNGYRNVKSGTTNKKKHNKFKKTPNGKIALINGSQAQSNSNAKNQKNGVNFEFQTKSLKDSNKQSTSPRASTSGVKWPEVKIKLEEKTDDNDSFDEGVNKEIMIKVEDDEDVIENKSINVFESLKHKIKEEPSSSDVEDVVENEGIKTFESLKQEIKEEPFADDAEDAVENIGIKLFESVKQEIKEEPSNSDAEDTVENKGIKIFESLKQEVKEEASSSNDEDYEDSSPEITVVKNEITNKKKDNGPKENGAVKESNPKSIKLAKKERRQRAKRTVFIGNVPKESDILAFEKKFGQFGIIESMRLKEIVPVNLNRPHKVAAIRKKNCWEAKNVCYFITYKNEDSAKKALSMNGKKWDGNILTVGSRHLKKQPEKTKAVFLGNLPYTIEDNELWELFKQCGQINSVRVLRDCETGLGRGIAYINFESVDGAVLAVRLNGTKIRKRKVRIEYSGSSESKAIGQERELKTSLSGTTGSASAKKIKIGDSEAAEIAIHDSVNAERRKVGKEKKKHSQGEKRRVKPNSRP